jgi:hypothetical protein
VDDLALQTLRVSVRDQIAEIPQFENILTPVNLAPAATFALPASVLTTPRGRVVAEMLFLLNRILLEKAGNEDGIEIRSNLNLRTGLLS